MTAQIPDTYRYKSKVYDIVAMTNPMGFDPRDYGLEPHSSCTACWRGYWCEYAIKYGKLIMERLLLYNKDGNYPDFNGVHVSPQEYKEMASGVKENDYIRVDGKIDGTFTGENMMGGEVTAILIKADSLEVGSYDELYAPAESTKTVGETQDQHGVKLTLDRIEYAKGEARVYVTVKNESGYKASIYTFDAKAIQDGKQFNHEDNYEAGYDDMGEILDGASKEGIIRFKGLDPEKPVKIQIGAYSDNFDIQMEDYVFDVE